MYEILHTLVELISTLGQLLLEIAALALQHLLLIAWIAWWLWAVNWNKAWSVLARGGWVVVVLLTILAAMVWSALAPGSRGLFDLFTLSHFWWQLGATCLFVALAFFCGYVQGQMGWGPGDLSYDPPQAVHGADHGHHH